MAGRGCGKLLAQGRAQMATDAKHCKDGRGRQDGSDTDATTVRRRRRSATAANVRTAEKTCRDETQRRRRRKVDDGAATTETGDGGECEDGREGVPR